MNPTRTYVIGIAGGSGSGKTTLINKIVAQTRIRKVVVLQHDWYYRHRPHLSFEERSQLNYDHPDALETEFLAMHLRDLIAGKPIEAPQYDYGTHLRLDETRLVNPGQIILVDGILIFNDETLRDLMSVRIFVDADSDIRFIRRMERDVKERGRTRESVVAQYLKTVKPMNDLFVEPCKQYADIIIPNGGENFTAVDLICARLDAFWEH